MNNKSKVITFWSHCPGSGASFTAINVAKALFDKKIKCALLDFDLTAPSLAVYFDNESLTHGLDNLIPYIVGENLTQDIFEENFQKTKEITWLHGIKLPEQSQYIKPEDLIRIVDLARNAFEVVIIDTSGIINNSGTYVALKSADKCFVVTDTDTIKIRRYDQIKSYVEAEVKNVSLVFNKGFNKAVPLDIKEVSEFYQIPEVYGLPDLGYDFTKSLNNGRWYDYMNKKKGMVKPYNKKLQELIEKGICN